MYKPLRLFLVLFLTACSGKGAAAEGTLTGHWRLSIATPYYGTLDMLATSEADGRYIVMTNGRETAERLAQLPTNGTWFPEGHTAAFRLRARATNEYEGQFASLQGTFRRGALDATFMVSGETLTGTIATGGPFSGAISGTRVPGAEAPLRDYPQLNSMLRHLMEEHLYDPRLILTHELSTTLALQAELATLARDDLDFVMAYAFTTARLPFSHFQVLRPEGGLEGLLTTRSNRGEAGEDLTLACDGDICVLTIRSFIGDEIPGQIADAFAQIQSRGTERLIVDLRENSGGSLAGAVLANHLLAERRSVGYFVSNLWWQSNQALPSDTNVNEAPAFEGTSLDDFYAAIQANGVMRVVSEPVASPFEGEVVLLASPNSSSMSELVLDALQRSGRATIVGEKTPGQMVSSRFYEMGEGFVARLPVADYFAADHTRIEGEGVTPDIEVPAGEALNRAMTLLSQ